MSVEVEVVDGVAILKMNSGKKNPINPELVEDLKRAVESVKSEASGIVLTSKDERFFSIGLDVPKLIDYDKQLFKEFIRSFNLLCLEIYTMPKPTVAAVNGHAIAGGCILALCCDYRFMVKEKALIGLNEIKLGLSVPYLPQRILQMIDERVARDVVYGGDFYSAEKALELGIIDGVFSKEELVEKSIEKVKSLNHPAEAFSAVKKNRTLKVKEECLALLEKDVETFTSLWFSEEGQKRLKEAMRSF
ncbi:Enoyl-CoA hydratase/isomerase [Ferroglobus placidus DSM 10642]|uniref:Enoyl-CoA hydratase/isomerase n=1 Tax=Ferroglobus placidus (strain DSM 10642 / AEDII12DO) TaxID=589924 RepID=D3RZY4_FERPA|nr:enoyl-CoA hydratase/isomerase family protein [Ferroglobus placidus]ADC66047.1 Enoyl-CoA hydratase/isomerase [Ferroglobus placidus DSM 10642]